MYYYKCITRFRKALMSKTLNKETHFGFETIKENEKAGRIEGVLNSVSSKYDVMNDVMSLGVHRI